MKYLAKAPHVQRTLRRELLSALDDSPDQRRLTFADVSSPEKTPYLEAVSHEIHRVAKVGPAVSKLGKLQPPICSPTWPKPSFLPATEPVTILGRAIPAGTTLIFNTAVACDQVTVQNEANLRAIDSVRSDTSLKHGLGGRGLWTDPEKFNPERWLVEDETGKRKFNPKAGVSTPFGLGTRACPGKSLAVCDWVCCRWCLLIVSNTIAPRAQDLHCDSQLGVLLGEGPGRAGQLQTHSVDIERAYDGVRGSEIVARR